MALLKLDGTAYAGMVLAGCANLQRHAEEVNDLNVFPIPDGDTGANMLLTMQGGAAPAKGANENLSDCATQIARGMLLGARGNSGVILSQFFAGLAEGFHTYREADVHALEKAVACGVGCAYEAVLTPTAGTILTVLKDACNYAGHCNCESIEAYFCAFIEEGKRALARTPDLLPVLKEAGVVDSGGAGMLYIVEGMYAFLCGKAPEEAEPIALPTQAAIDPDLFGADSVMEFGYCTELLLRLQTCKTDPAQFDVAILTEYLQSIGDSVVTVKNDSIVKLHVHTMTPYKVLEFCQRYGEFLTVKIENMMLQHNETVAGEPTRAAMSESTRERRPIGIVAVAMGDGICESFCELGADEVIRGGQTMNPSAQDFLEAFARVNADTLFVLPNNGNVLLAARQAAQIFRDSDVRVIPTHSIGDGYAVLSMLDLDSGDVDTIEQEMNDAMGGVLTAEVSRSIRDAEMNGVSVQKDDYIGIMGKAILAAGKCCEEVALQTLDKMELDTHDLLLVIRGKGIAEADSASLCAYAKQRNPLIEVCETDGGQDIYDYILVAE
ncbi:MAG: DAK2 domain-containing protein [Clostridia bacterium]|nr:DAK2 domain-containing protein [Clostridia bacterium]